MSKSSQIATRPLPSDANISGRTFDEQEIANLQEVIRSGTLNCTKGTWVNRFQEQFGALYQVPFTRCVTSGTAAIHAAVAAIDPEPGDEIITTPITDMGALTPILYQTAIPVFADIDPVTYNITADTIAPHINPRTKAIIVTHLFGNPCDMRPILALAHRHGLPVIEDTAQAYLARYEGKLLGTLGDIGCFSLQQGKHMTTGEGGIVITADPELARRVVLFVDKAWGYGDPDPDHYFLALNYRMTELQGAIAAAQLTKLERSVSARIHTANLMTQLIQGAPGISPPQAHPHSQPVYWKYCLKVDPEAIRGGVDAFSEMLKQDFGIFSQPRYIKKPAFMCRIFQEQATFGNSKFPFIGPHRDGAPCIDYSLVNYPGAVNALERICVLPWNERYSEEDVRYVADSVCETANRLNKAR